MGRATGALSDGAQLTNTRRTLGSAGAAGAGAGAALAELTSGLGLALELELPLWLAAPRALAALGLPDALDGSAGGAARGGRTLENVTPERVTPSKSQPEAVRSPTAMRTDLEPLSETAAVRASPTP